MRVAVSRKGQGTHRQFLLLLALMATLAATVLCSWVWSPSAGAVGPAPVNSGNMLPGAAPTPCAHGISLLVGCNHSTDVGQPYVCTYMAINAVDECHDTLMITSVTDVVHAYPNFAGDVPSSVALPSTTPPGNLLATATPTLAGGASCTGSPIVSCTLPFGASVTFTATFYTVQPCDPNPLRDTATLTWYDTCLDGTPTPNCPLDQPEDADAGGQSYVQTPPCITSTYNGINTCDMQPGDVLLNWDKHMNHVMWWLIAGQFGGYWTHAGIYAGNKGVIESYPDALWSQTPGVVKHCITDSGFWKEDDWAILRSKSATYTDTNNAVDWASQQADAHLPYNWDYARPDYTGTYYCSQLVWRAYEMQDINVQCDRVPLAIAPDELYPRPLCDVLQGYDLRLVKQRPNMRRAIIQIHSPANLYVTDPLGRHAGVDPATGLEVDGIPDAIYSGPGSDPQVMSILDLEGTWQVQLIGTGTGSYALTADTVDPAGPVETTVTGATSIGHIDSYSLSYPTQAGEPITVEPVSPVGGIADMPDVPGAHLEASASHRSPIPVPAEVAAALAAGVVTLGVGGLYARRRWLR